MSYCMMLGTIWICFSSYFCFQHIAQAEGNIGNKKNEKNISHIAQRCHAITSLSLGIIYLFTLDSSILNLLIHLFQGKLNIWKLENLLKFFGCIVCETRLL